MQKLYSMYERVKRNMKKVIACALIIGGVPIITIYTKSGKNIYSGKIDSYQIVYEENKFSLKIDSNLEENIMTIKKGNTIYKFFDSTKETNIDWKNQKKPNFEKDLLEKVIIQVGNSSKTFNSYDIWEMKNKIDTSTIEGKITKEVFDKANPLYNSLRAKIREELRAKYNIRNKLFLDSFNQ